MPKTFPDKFKIIRRRGEGCGGGIECELSRKFPLQRRRLEKSPGANYLCIDRDRAIKAGGGGGGE